MTSLSACYAFFKIAPQSSLFLLVVIHDCIPALVWPNTGRRGRPKMWAVALVVQQPPKILSQNLQAAIIMIVFIFSSIFAFFSNSCVFSPTPPYFSPTFPIPRGSERVLYSAHTYALSACTNVPTNRPIPAHPPLPPAHPAPTRPRPAPPTRPPPGPHPAPPCCVQRREGGVAAAWGQRVLRRGRGGGGRGDSEQRRAAA